LIRAQARTEAGAVLLDGPFQEEIYISEDMFADHSVTSYLHALHAVGLVKDAAAWPSSL
jgi:hypothetical protein